MKTKIEEIAYGIYAYCTLAMDYDAMGLIFKESSFISAIKNDKAKIESFTEDEFIVLKEALQDEVLSLYESNKQILTKLEASDKPEAIKHIFSCSATEEMAEAEKFLKYIDEELSYEYFKKIVE